MIGRPKSSERKFVDKVCHSSMYLGAIKLLREHVLNDICRMRSTSFLSQALRCFFLRLMSVVVDL